ncbi:hypothetical protein HGRIS_011952 [Hohenbuehelia grisea]|uniref:Uncharacterized protein n=1 Tax=Hohenbuehelia grisea TaxID=104357 RepID=A0ABR3JYW0_9AGAR
MCPNINYPLSSRPDVIAVSHTGLTIAAGSGQGAALDAQESFRFVLQALLMVVLSSSDEPKLREFITLAAGTIAAQVVWFSILKAVGVQPVLDVATVVRILLLGEASTTKDILLQNPAFAAEQQAFWFANALSTSLGIAAPSDIFTESELANLIKAAQANMTAYAQQFSDGNSQL